MVLLKLFSSCVIGTVINWIDSDILLHFTHKHSKGHTHRSAYFTFFDSFFLVSFFVFVDSSPEVFSDFLASLGFSSG